MVVQGLGPPNEGLAVGGRAVRKYSAWGVAPRGSDRGERLLTCAWRWEALGNDGRGAPRSSAAQSAVVVEERVGYLTGKAPEASILDERSDVQPASVLVRCAPVRRGRVALASRISFRSPSYELRSGLQETCGCRLSPFDGRYLGALLQALGRHRAAALAGSLARPALSAHE
jgi:hypothetical protein